MMSGSWEELAWKKYLEARIRPGEYLLNRVVSQGLDRRHLRQAGRILEAAVGTGEPFPASAYLNLGIYYMLERKEDPEAVQKMVRTWNTYLTLVPRNDPSSELVRQVLENPETAELKIGTY